MRKQNSDFEARFISEEGSRLKNRDYFGYVELDEFACYVIADGITEITDIESADRKFNLRLDDFLGADNSNFAHDFIRIQGNIVRGNFPATDFGDFVPRFAGRSE